MTKRAITAFSATALLFGVFAGGASAAKPENKKANNQAAKQCQAEKKELGNKTFKQAYNGGKRAMQTCKRENRGEQRQQIRNAQQECRDERAADEDTFNSTHGTNPNGRNAFGKCVSGKVAAEDEAEVEATKNAAKQCKAERRKDSDAFREEYGSNKNNKNAFGKCVSQNAQEQGSEEELEGEPEGELES